MEQETMLALNLHGVGDLRYEAVPRPVPQADEVLLRVCAVGICGSDIPRVFTKGTYHFPTIIGHEFAGEIVAAADKTLVGRGASVFPLLPCGTCPACETGHYAQCQHYSYYGSRQDGGMAEYIAVKKRNLCLMPEGVSYEEAAMNEPTAVALHAFRQSGAGLGDTLLIYGVGTIALIIAQWARAAGVRRIILAARTPEKVAFAQKLGFDDTYNVMETDIRARVAELTDGQGTTACIEGTGESEGLEACVWNVRTFGRVVTLGNPAGSMTLTQDGYWQILRRELQLVGTWNSSFQAMQNDWQDSLRGMANHSLELKKIITHRFALKDYQQAFALMHEKRECYGKVMFIL
ncbi:MAG: galactitol-1-phosphate 5-dehydrogenase [Selenomonadaceae bacterium]|nr:galactitol-1-phosphate 5-dehydrogenase [Selenomonadaceae bacterium]MDY3917255.1 galactitol-1-phosphate 5-dehydrogenase [Selenomonadaceae bacterium]